ncbi:PorT family protein [Polaribacter sp.]|nr:PorT family protein [Polaribacter sp.]
MNKLVIAFLLFCTPIVFAQKDSLNLGDRYADDQIYLAVTYNQMNQQPSKITRSGFSYGLSSGFLKDIILNKKGTFSFALGLGYGFDFYNHKLKVEELNNITLFSNDNTLTSNTYFSHNLEIPFEIRWRTSTANKYKFWRIYTGVKFLYNFSNSFENIASNQVKTTYSEVSAYNKLQYGLTLSAGYATFNFHVFYGVSPIYNDAKINNEVIDSKALKFGLIFYFL